MGVCKKCALLDTDFLYKTHLARNKDHHTLADFVLDFEDYDFFCHEMIREELTRHQIQPDPNPWLEDKIREGRIKIFSVSGYQRLRVPVQKVFDDIYMGKFQLLRNGDLQYRGSIESLY